MESAEEYWTARALLDWQIEMGVDEAIGDDAIDRYAFEDKQPKAKVASKADDTPYVAPKAGEVDHAQIAADLANAAQDLDGLRAAMGAFEHCDLKAGARNLVFSAGTAGSDVMIITDAPDRDEDRAGALFVKSGGALFDKMFAAIGMTRDHIYAAPVLPWNPPQNRPPNEAELAMMLPFLQRHIALAQPKILVLMGNGPCQALLGTSGMTRLRGGWTDVAGVPALPMFAPSYLLNTPMAKRDAWADLLSLKAKLKGLS